MDILSDIRIGVLYGGISSEREISLVTGKAVADALRHGGHTVELLDVRDVPLSELTPERMDVAFIALHGTFGEDGGIQAVLDATRVPYTGSGVDASRTAMDKVTSKQRFERAGVPTPAYVEIEVDWAESHKLRAAASLGFPVVLKPAREGSSLGIVIVHSEEQLAEALAKPFEYDHRVLAEQFIDGRELTVGILDDHPLPIIELLFDGSFFDYSIKYSAGKATHAIDPDLPPGVADAVRAASLAAHECLGCSGFSRVDIRLADSGVPYVLEVNTVPGMTGTSLLPDAARAAGISFTELCERAVTIALGTRPRAKVHAEV